MEMQEGNKLIAEFMGEKWQPKNYMNPQYNQSWDLIMPAVIKCHTIGKEMEEKFKDNNVHNVSDPEGWRYWSYNRVVLDTNIKTVWNSVIEFIECYNKNAH